ncbi:MAG: hydrogenase expression/formation protein HypE, partial [Clostridia bacterium]|nr:hydrogenase expression/formation protein HypE [Clostridia bacterium]
REGLSFTTPSVSDCAPLNGMVKELLAQCSNVRCMRDPTRGGVATVAGEIARQSKVGINIFEQALPIEQSVLGACELFGMDPLYMANEGKLLIFIAAEEADKAIEVLRGNKYGKNAAIIGEVTDKKQGVVLQTAIGSSRILDELTGEILPRIC